MQSFPFFSLPGRGKREKIKTIPTKVVIIYYFKNLMDFVEYKYVKLNLSLF